jgi:hypothetical protein
VSGNEETARMLAAKSQAIFPHLDERQRRRLLGAEARALGHGGIRVVARPAGVREATVSLGADELEAGTEPLGRARRPCGAASGPWSWIRGCARRCWRWSSRRGGRPYVATAVDHEIHADPGGRGRPLTSHEVIVNTIAATTTRTGLTVRAEFDAGSYDTGVKTSDEQLASLSLDRQGWHSDWNYTPWPEHPRRPATALPARRDSTSWAHPALTGMPPAD